METTKGKAAAPTPTIPVSSNQLDDAVQQVERLYRAVVGGDPPAEAPHAEIPPERDPGTYVNAQVQRLIDALGNATRRDEQPTWAPASSISEEADAFVIDIDLAGVQRDDIKITIASGTLEISGMRTLRNGERNRHIRVSERPLGLFRRALALPPNCDTASLSAQLRDGVLSVRIPRAHTTQMAARNVAIA